jgi:hypothetical protein
MTTPVKTLIGRDNSLASTGRVYETDDAIVAETSDQYELSRKSVLFEDILLITFHREIGWMFVAVQSVIIVFALLVAGTTYAANGPFLSVAIIAAFSIPSIIALIVRLIFKVDVISIFGRRSRAAIRFSFRKKRARELYGRLCYRTRQKQRVPEETTPEVMPQPESQPESAV